MTTEGWPDDRLTSPDAPSLVRHHAGPADDPDRYELLGEAEGADEAWHVIDHRAASGEALFTLAALRPAVADRLEVVHRSEHGDDGDHDGDHDGDPAPIPPEVLWRERAAGLARVHHARLAGVVDIFVGAAPHVPGQADRDAGDWNYAVLEQAAGRSVADWLRDDPGAGIEERFTVLATAAGVLQELHRGSQGSPPLVHGDITPRSVRLGGFWPADGVRLAGASLGGLRRGPVQQRSAGAYTAPEVRGGALPSTASDVFGFGATAVLVLTGMPPSTSPDGVLDPALVKRQLAAAALTAQHPGLGELLLQALSDDPAQRPDRLPAWVNGMRAFVEPRPSLDPYDGIDLDPAPRPAAARPARSLPKRPVVVVVGALLLATAGTAVAIAAVQQGRLKDVPNPVAIVQPPQTSETLATSSAPLAPAPTSAGSTAGSAAGTQAPTTRRSSSSTSGTTSGSGSTLPTGTPTSLPAQTVPPNLADTTAPPVVAPPVVVPPPVESPTTAVIPPVTGPDVSIPPVTRTPSAPPSTPADPSTGPSDTPTDTSTDTSSPTASDTSTGSAPTSSGRPETTSGSGVTLPGLPTVVDDPTGP